jgi:hypothetical protein
MLTFANHLGKSEILLWVDLVQAEIGENMVIQ